MLFRYLFSAVSLFCFVLCASDNLLRNGDFEQDNFRQEVRSDWLKDHHEISLFQEDYTWNKCLKLEVKKIEPDAEGVRKIYARLWIGFDGKTPGLQVKPNCTYQVSVELRGNVPSASVSTAMWDNDDPSPWEGLTNGSLEPPGGAKITGQWSRIQGRFRTGSDTKRAAVVVSLWGDSARQSNFDWEVGQYLLVDNVSLSEVRSLGEEQVSDLPSTVLNRKIIQPSEEQHSGFLNIARLDAAKEDTRFSIQQQQDGFLLDIFCQQSEPLRANVKEDGLGIWADDAVEIFFGPGSSKDRNLSQFVVAAGGGRYMGNGTEQLHDLHLWQASTKAEEGGWSLQVKIPYSLLGFAGPLPSGELLPFNISRQRKGEYSSWAPVRNGFHDVPNYHFLLLGSKKDYAKKILDSLGKSCPENLKPAWQALAAAQAEPVELYRQAYTLERMLFNHRIGSASYLLGRVSPHGDFSMPFEMQSEMLLFDDKPIKLRAAINEICPLPLMISNRSSKLASYRVFVHPNVEFRMPESGGLLEDFPGANISLYEGIVVKDGEEQEPSLRLDPLPLMNQANIVTVPPGGSALVWVNFDCSGVKAGNYKGAIRVTPLTEYAEMPKSVKYIGGAKDYPLELELLPIELPMKNPRRPSWLMTNSTIEDVYKLHGELGGRLMGINPWSFKFSFDEQGEITSETILPAVVDSVKTRLAWNEKYGFEGGMKVFVHFSTYRVFERAFLNKKIKFGTPAWRNAWRNNLLAIAANMRECGLQDDEWGIEVFDEPQGKNIEEDLEVSRIARETLPNILLSITWAADNFGHTPDTIRRFMPYINDHCIWHGHLNKPAYRELAAELRAKGMHYSFYACSTSLRLNLYNYYRLHAWKGVEFGAELIGLYVMINAPTGTHGSTNWKMPSSGGIAYRSDQQCIRSIRMEVFRQGLTDIAYLDLLEDLCKGKDSATAREALKFVQEAPKKAAIELSHDRNAADRLREQAIQYILALQEGK
ncbi:MAG: hypothetical protein RBT25_08990 [Lentisphaeria bacterium]|nr:hypothetical protein [Lentisphaeria bacterium]